jgi:hypothetical protein
VADQPRATVMWRKSSHSGVTDCVELARSGLRDSKHPDEPGLECSKAELHAFVNGVKAGELDDLT